MSPVGHVHLVVTGSQQQDQRVARTQCRCVSVLSVHVQCSKYNVGVKFAEVGLSTQKGGLIPALRAWLSRVDLTFWGRLSRSKLSRPPLSPPSCTIRHLIGWAPAPAWMKAEGYCTTAGHSPLLLSRRVHQSQVTTFFAHLFKKTLHAMQTHALCRGHGCLFSSACSVRS
jgi:hypothetical protein